MTTTQKILVAAIFGVAGGAGIYLADQNWRLRDEVRLLRQQQAALSDQNQLLRHERDAATNRLASLQSEVRSNSVPALAEEESRELLRLRGAVGVLRAQLAEATKRADAAQGQQAAPRFDGARAQAFYFSSNSVVSQGRPIGPENLAPAMVDADPAAALAYSRQLSPESRRKFLDSVFVTWARKDTAAALRYVEQQIYDPVEKEAAMRAIRSIAPVGIGAELRQQDGYTVVNRLLPGGPAEASGQLHAGDRIVAVAQGGGAFVDARNMSLADLVQNIRGAPGTPLQLQVLSADAPPGSQPRFVTLTRDQIMHKQ